MEAFIEFGKGVAGAVLSTGGVLAEVLLLMLIFVCWRMVKLQNSVDSDRAQAAKEADVRGPAFARSADAIIEIAETTRTIHVLLSRIDGMLSSQRSN